MIDLLASEFRRFRSRRILLVLTGLALLAIAVAGVIVFSAHEFALEDLPDESVDGLLAYCAAPADDVALVLVHSGGQKGSGVLTKLRKLSPVTEVKSVCRDRVAASRKPTTRSNRLRVPAETTLLAMAAMKAC